MKSKQIRLEGAPRPPATNTGLSTAAQRLREILAWRQVLHLDRYGLLDLADYGLARSQVFAGLYELIVTNQVQIKAASLGHVVLCLPQPIPIPPISRMERPLRQISRLNPRKSGIKRETGKSRNLGQVPIS